MCERALALADRCEAATGPDRELDCAIGCAVAGFFVCKPRWEGAPVSYGQVDADGSRSEPGTGGDWMVPRYTASLDAAMTLAPKGWFMQLSDWQAPILRAHGPWQAIFTLDRDDFRRGFDARCDHAATPALALCAAALRALATQEPRP